MEREWRACNDPRRMLKWLTHGMGGLPGKYPVSDRQLRLFACACCRQVWHLLTAEPGQKAVEAAERLADGDCEYSSIEDIDFASEEAADQYATWGKKWRAGWAASWCLFRNPRKSAREVLLHLDKPERPPALPDDDEPLAAPAALADLFRDIVGNPFRPVDSLGFVPNCEHAEIIHALARTIYDDLDFALMPVLADALEEAGCEQEALLRHLRGQEPCRECNGTGTWPREYTDRHGNLLGHTYHEMVPHVACQGTGWMTLGGSHVRGCWAIDLILGKE